jgi:pyruvate oxidase
LQLLDDLGKQGCGLPGALASNIAYPGRQAIAITGDGAFQMVMQDFATADLGKQY